MLRRSKLLTDLTEPHDTQAGVEEHRLRVVIRDLERQARQHCPFVCGSLFSGGGGVPGFSFTHEAPKRSSTRDIFLNNGRRPEYLVCRVIRANIACVSSETLSG